MQFQINELPSAGPELDLDAPFCTIDQRAWTVGDLRKELMSHPLVFRTKNLNRGNFAAQLELAMVDMMRDRFLTQEAYAKSLDDSPEIGRTMDMWKDAYLAIRQQRRVMAAARERGIVIEHDQPGMLRYWESYLAELQRKYGASVRINREALEKISVTNVDFVALRPGVPYPIAVPGFPILILSDNLEYARQRSWF